MHILIVISRYYESIAEELEIGATAALQAHGAGYDLVEVPGAFEIPSAIRMGIASGRYDGYIALGCVVRGETSHYDYVCGESARGLNTLALEHMAPIGYGILTVNTLEQAKLRAAVREGNKGREAVIACLSLLRLKAHLGLVQNHDINARNA